MKKLVMKLFYCHDCLHTRPNARQTFFVDDREVSVAEVGQQPSNVFVCTLRCHTLQVPLHKVFYTYLPGAACKLINRLIDLLINN